MIIQAPIHAVQIRPLTPSYDFGTVSALDHPKIFHDFVYTNNGTAPVQIVRLQPSCHCTSGVVLPASASNLPVDAAGQTLPITVAVGQSVTVREIIDLTQEPAGPVSKSLSLFLQGDDNLAAMYTVTGNESSDVTMTPRILDFGNVNPDKPSSLKLTVTIDKRLSPSQFPPLTSNNSNLVITPGPIVDTAVPAGIGKPVTHMLTRVYTVSPAQNMPLGDLRGGLVLNPTSSSPSFAPTEFQYVEAEASGKVVGPVEAQPDSVSFGTLVYGQGGQASVTLYSNNLADLTNIKAVSKSPYVSITADTPDAVLDTVQPGTPPALAHHVLLRVVIDRKMPTGLYNSEIKVVLSDGHRLLIPVIGYVGMMQQ